VFDDFANIIRQHYPSSSFIIEGDNYPAPAYRQMISQGIGLMKIALIAAIAFGQNPFDIIGMQTPSVYQWAQQNKISSCLLLFFVCNAIEGQLLSTGAFEVYVDGVEIWSKLKSGQLLPADRLIKLIDEQRQNVHRV